MNDLTSVVGASPAIALMIVLNGLGFILKAIPQVPNKLIPIILFFLGGGIYPFIGNYHAAEKMPAPLLFVYGCGIALAAVGLFESGRTLLLKDSTDVPPTTTIPKPNP